MGAIGSIFSRLRESGFQILLPVRERTRAYKTAKNEAWGARHPAKKFWACLKGHAT